MHKSLADELMERRAALINEARAIAQTGVAENRDLTADEQSTFDGLITQSDSLEQRAKQIHDGEKAAHELEESFRSVTGNYPGQPNASLCPALIVSPDNVQKHANAMAEGRSFGAVEEARALVQVNPSAANAMGGPQAWAQTGAREPRHLIAFAGIPVAQLTGVSATMPTYTLPSATAGVNESTAHGEVDGVVDLPLSALRYGRFSKVSAAVNAFVPVSNLVNLHAVAIAKDLDLKAVGAIETAASTPAAFNADVAGNVRANLLAVSAAVLADVSDLVIFGSPSDIALLGETSPTNGGDVASVTERFHGARLYPTLSATAGQVTIFHPASFLVFMSALQSASQIDPTDGSNSFGQWLHATAPGQGLSGSAKAVDVVTP
ncbi:hypothetical protein QYF68_23265 [Mycolicibacterium austroafricanum]|uniref:Phage major capsid protein n=1 Tax=Mycolicibacterium austroafricanum TaxID=39687 RepID=A0ABT8HKA5_MYCAO|nr:hypothetical protein [Mycolicibacterium austroafricanum]MDN4520712.1 hypothetical protein [Mycolicibacterium austroafricanum]